MRLLQKAIPGQERISQVLQPSTQASGLQAAQREAGSMSGIIDWFADVIDSFFVESDLVDLNMTEAELCDRAAFDSLATATAKQAQEDDNPVPIGKRVF